MKTIIFFILSILIFACNLKVKDNNKLIANDNIALIDSNFKSILVENFLDSSILNTTDKTINLIYNTMEYDFGNKKNKKTLFDTECMMCEPFQIYKNGMLFCKKLFIAPNEVLVFENEIEIDDTLANIKMIGSYSLRKKRSRSFSKGQINFNFTSKACNDADNIFVKLQFDEGEITFKNLLNASFFEYDLDNNGLSEQYLLGTRNCTQEIVLFRIN